MSRSYTSEPHGHSRHSIYGRRPVVGAAGFSPPSCSAASSPARPCRARSLRIPRRPARGRRGAVGPGFPLRPDRAGPPLRRAAPTPGPGQPRAFACLRRRRGLDRKARRRAPAWLPGRPTPRRALLDRGGGEPALAGGAGRLPRPAPPRAPSGRGVRVAPGGVARAGVGARSPPGRCGQGPAASGGRRPGRRRARGAARLAAADRSLSRHGSGRWTASA